jgi:hypothetical protein
MYNSWNIINQVNEVNEVLEEFFVENKLFFLTRWEGSACVNIMMW